MKMNFSKTRLCVYLSLALATTACSTFSESSKTSEPQDPESLLELAISQGLDPTLTMEATASGMTNSVTPLIHSAGVVIYGQEEDSTSVVKYRKIGSSSWNDGLELAWDPIYSALSGSIINLTPDTQYEMEVVVTDSYGDESLYEFDFKTRYDAPIISNDKIYYLSDIYTGGQLDLEALGIEGSKEGGYAKIIGDGPIIDAGDDHLAAVNIGGQAYIMLENLTIKGGQRYGIYAKRTHDIWIKGCDISAYGRVGAVMKNGRAYTSETSNSPINYDSGIYLEESGVSVIEECEIHDPNGQANHWGYGHPYGPNALQVFAYHPDEQYRGQMIVRNNRFYGTDTKRFNDVIEGRKNFWRNGGFIRDSAIYNNYLAYANDDLIEIDGGQRNVLVYNNEITQGYAGISVAPNRLGPSYVFHNHIHDLGDERGKEWTAIKAGGLVSQPGGKTYLIENYINTPRNGIAASRVNNDSTFWIEAINNVVINHNFNNMVGLGIYDAEKYAGSLFKNNIFFNLRSGAPNLNIDYNSLIEHPLTYSEDLAQSYDEASPSVVLPITADNWVNNFSVIADTADVLSGATSVTLDNDLLSNFSNQTKYGSADITNGSELTLTGNIWKKMPLPENLSADSLLTFNIRVEGDVEIAGVGLARSNSLDRQTIFNLAGSQDYGHNLKHLVSEGELTKVSIKPSDYDLTDANYLVFVLDNDISASKNNGMVYFENIAIESAGANVIAEPEENYLQINSGSLSNFSDQVKYGTASLSGDTGVILEGNIWKKMKIDESFDENTTVSFDIQIEGDMEIAGIGLETNNTLSESRVFSVGGSQDYGRDLSHLMTDDGMTRISFKPADYGVSDASYLVFILDNDIDKSKNNATVFIENVSFSEATNENISVGINK